jgi:1-acyl-sn-glycerol-3-phosphate acyltransferase
MPLFYHTATGTMKVLLLTFSRWRVYGRENVPLKGPLIVAANHLNLSDPPLLCASIPRRIVFMIKEELYHSPRGGPFVRAFGSFPVHRGGVDREALRQAVRVLEQGLALGMFPEGSRSPNGQMQQAYLGTALIALRSRAPILPVGINGSEKVKGVKEVVFGHPHITVTVGQPFFLPTNEDRVSNLQLKELTNLIMSRIAELLPESYRGVYGDRKGC